MTLHIKNLSFTYSGNSQAVLKNINLHIRPGECHCLLGATGAGKSTLARIAAGYFPRGRMSGDVCFCGQALQSIAAGQAGLILQNPEPQLLTSDIGSEIAFGLENLSCPTHEIPQKIAQALEMVDLNKPLDTPPTQLSMGQKYRLLVACFLVMSPKLLVLDEPCAQLDSRAVEGLSRILDDFLAKGGSLLLCEHEPFLLQDSINFFHKLDDGKLRPSSALKSQGFDFFTSPAKDSAKILTINRAKAAYEHKKIWENLSLEVKAGQRIAITGSNGKGKSTLLRCICGFMRPSAGAIDFTGHAPSPATVRGKIGLMRQSPGKQIFENTVKEEIIFSASRQPLKNKNPEQKVNEMLELLQIKHLAAKSPFKLSFGEQHLVVLASTLIADPSLLLLDDSFAGLDQKYKGLLLHILYDLSKKNDMTIIWTGHHCHGFSSWFDYIYELIPNGLQKSNAY